MIFFTGGGSWRTSVGTAKIWSLRASFGLTSRSTASMRYLPRRCFSQISSRLRSADCERAAWPAP